MLCDCVKQKGGCEVFMSTSEVFVLKMLKEGKSVRCFFWYLLKDFWDGLKENHTLRRLRRESFQLDSLILN